MHDLEVPEGQITIVISDNMLEYEDYFTNIEEKFKSGYFKKLHEEGVLPNKVWAVLNYAKLNGLVVIPSLCGPYKEHKDYSEDKLKHFTPFLELPKLVSDYGMTLKRAKLIALEDCVITSDELHLMKKQKLDLNHIGSLYNKGKYSLVNFKKERVLRGTDAPVLVTRYSMGMDKELRQEGLVVCDIKNISKYAPIGGSTIHIEEGVLTTIVAVSLPPNQKMITSVTKSKKAMETYLDGYVHKQNKRNLIGAFHKAYDEVTEYLQSNPMLTVNDIIYSEFNGISKKS